MNARGALAAAAALAALAATGVATTGGAGAATSGVDASARPVPEVLAGDTWLRHLREDLLPYWELPAALGEPLGNFPTFRDQLGQLDPERGTWRGVSTLARGVYGYSVAFHLTGEERYLTYARAGLSAWSRSGAMRAEAGPTTSSTPGHPQPDRQQGLFDLASVGMAYGMYFNVTREPWSEEACSRSGT